MIVKEKQVCNFMKDKVRRFMAREADGIGIIEIILILVVIIGLILLFRTQIQEIIKNAFETISTNTGEINTNIELN